MRWQYVFKHWGCTLLLGVILFILTAVLGAEEAMVITLMLPAVSLVFSIPTLIIYIVVFHWLKKYSIMDTKWVKLILVTTCNR